MGVFNTVTSGLNVLFTPVLYGVVASLALQLTTWEKGDRTQDKLQDTNGQASIVKGLSDTFDFIVVGGGTAGSILVNRLSEHYSVLLLEAGGEPAPPIYVPALARNLLNRPEVDWSYKTVAQRRGCLLSQFKRASWSAGKGLGGTGNLGWMVSLRGHPRDFDNWAKLTEDKEWGYENMRKWFQRHENFVGNTTDPQAHAQGGDLTIQLPDYRPLAQDFVSAGKELSYPNLDLNGRFSEGFDEIYSPCKKGEKLTTYKAMVEPHKRRNTLKILKFAQVSRILLRKSDNAAYGVEFERHGKKYSVYARREVLLSAGALQSPKILLLSGIGPKRHLEDVGIKPLVNLPVGRNLQDHLSVHLGPFFLKDPLSFDFDRDVNAKSLFEYGTFGTGPVTTTGYTATALIASSLAKLRGEKDWPDLQLSLHAVSVHQNYAQDLAHAFGLTEETLKKYYKHAVGQPSFHIQVTLSRPYARGEMRLASRNAQNPLIIDPKYFDDPWDFDVKTLVEGVKKAVQLVEETQRFKGLGARFTGEILPGCEQTRFKSDDYWECYVRSFAISAQNPVGTVTMGPVGSPHTVVDTQLKVVGVPGLRVVDSGVMPSIVVGGTQRPTMAIAEKAAHDILTYWQNKGPKQGESVPIVPQDVQVASSEVFHVTQTTPKTQTTTATGLLQSFAKTSESFQKSLEQLSQISKQISQMVEPRPLQNKQNFVNNVPTTSTTQATYKPQMFFHSSSTAAPTPKSTTQKLLKPEIFYYSSSTAAPSPTTTTKQTTPYYVPLRALPTQQVQISNYSPTPPSPKVTTYRPPHTELQQPPTTYRTSAEQQQKSVEQNSLFSVNVPIYQKIPVTPSPTPAYQQPRPNNVRIYTATSGSGNDQVLPHKLLQNAGITLRKVPQYRKFIPPKSTASTTTSTTTTRLTTTTTTTTTPRPTTTRNPVVFEQVHSQVLPQNFAQHFIELPHTVEYHTYQQPSASYQHSNPTYQQPQRTTTSPPTTTTTTPRPKTTRKLQPINIVPAVQLTASALETTTTRYRVPASMENLMSTSMHSIPEEVLLTGLEPYSLVDVTTATEPPIETKKAKDPPLFYIMRKKVQQNQQKSQQQQKQNHYYSKNPYVSQEVHQVQVQVQPMRKQRPQNHHHQHKPQRRPHHSHNQQQNHHRRPVMHTAQSQQHYQHIALPPSHFASPQRQQVQHYLTTVEDLHSGGSNQIRAVLPSPHQRHRQQNHYQQTQRKHGGGNSAGRLTNSEINAIIQKAISSEVVEQGVLDQLLPIH